MVTEHMNGWIGLGIFFSFCACKFCFGFWMCTWFLDVYWSACLCPQECPSACLKISVYMEKECGNGFSSCDVTRFLATCMQSPVLIMSNSCQRSDVGMCTSLRSIHVQYMCIYTCSSFHWASKWRVSTSFAVYFAVCVCVCCTCVKGTLGLIDIEANTLLLYSTLSHSLNWKKKSLVCCTNIYMYMPIFINNYPCLWPKYSTKSL